ncbi:Sec7-domain-containing protein [Gigaspora margarita]|uniref:Sec7-domain-containing protein n=1 Tax=Gigaspora margarita TaxID=4874 RepID=A0A8H4AC60_GIGMA|nr:Sec7-domain-containing protein [Gigaspora margarita]
MSSSTVFIINALKNIGASKEGRRNKKLKESVNKALESIKEDSEESSNADIIFEPLQAACKTRVIALMTTALDCIGKLFSYNYLIEANGTYISENVDDIDESSKETQDESKKPLVDRAIDTVCDCFVGENTDDKVQLQIIKALLAAVSSTKTPIHQSSLLKSIRYSYNIFLLSRNPVNQTIAQGTLTQMVNQVFSRIKVNVDENLESPLKKRIDFKDNNYNSIEIERSSENEVDLGISKSPKLNEHNNNENERHDQELNGKRDSFEKAAVFTGTTPNTVELESSDALEFGQWNESHDSNEDVVKVVEEEMVNFKDPEEFSAEGKTLSDSENQQSSNIAPTLEQVNVIAINQDDLCVKDAFLVFRALCKLSMKPMSAEASKDLKSPPMRSKLLSLHLILTTLSTHIHVFSSPNVVFMSSAKQESTPFVHAVKQYLCLSLSRNAVSPLPKVFEISLEIFWKCMSTLRSHLKKEIEVFFKEIFLPILEMRTSSMKHKCALMSILSRICSEPQTLVELYLNYDCDREALDNTYERIVNIVSKITTTHTTINSTSGVSPSTNSDKDKDPNSSTTSLSSISTQSTNVVPPSLDTKSITTSTTSQSHPNLPDELALKYQGLECLVSILRSLVAWCSNNKSSVDGIDYDKDESTRKSEETVTDLALSQNSVTIQNTNKSSPSSSTMSMSGSYFSVSSDIKSAIPKAMDDPEQFENLKHRKQVLQDGIKTFNFKPKRGIQALISAGFIPSTEPLEVAKFLLNTEGLNKTMIGEYLGEGETENIATMHAFVDLMDFSNMNFVDALRHFLQSFRLPGEAQKIDRFMLKFAERYVDGNPTQFANADTAYVLAYSVIMLNTDLHNPQIKRRMTKSEFIKNNRGIDDNSDLPEEFLTAIYDEIQNDEIKMKDEQDAALVQPTTPNSGGIGIANLGSAIVNVRRDFKREAYQAASQEMANKTENLFRTMLRAQRRGVYTSSATFYSASHFEHVRPMFEVAWMPVLAGLSGPLQVTEDLETANLALEGFKLAIRIISLFDMELERNAFVTTLSKFTFLNNLGEMRPKNVDAIKTLLDIALVEGNYLKGSWQEVLTCVSQLERFQLISTGVDQTVVPDLFNARKQPRPHSVDNGARRSSSTSKRSFSSRPTSQLTFAEDVAIESRSSHVVVAVDKVFSSSANLSGTAIVEFVRALSNVSWEEIQSSTMTEHPRMFSLQKLVEISYYNMGRIRMEWSNIWTILGEHFNLVGCHPNINVGFFAIDSLRQLAMQFLGKEELPHFKFQKDFLRPFEYILVNNTNVSIKDMVLRCVQQMIQARSHNIKSGWKALFGVLSAAAKETNESIVIMAFDIVRMIIKDQFDSIVSNTTYPDLMVCLTEFCKNKRFQKTSLQAIDLMCMSILKMLEYPQYKIHYPINGSNGVENSPGVKIITNDDPSFKFWYPLLFGFHDVIMDGEDLEVRTRALTSMFDTLKKYGITYSLEFWGVICRQVLFPIFGVLRSRSDISKFSSHEDMSVWLSTTMIQALRNMIDLFTHYFDTLEVMIDGILDLLGSCITQENDTLARIGSSCLQQFIQANVKKLDYKHWGKISSMFVQLFENTTPYNLLDEGHRFIDAAKQFSEKSNGQYGHNVNGFVSEVDLNTRSMIEEHYSEPEHTTTMAPDEQRAKEFNKIIMKCLLQLLLIDTVNEFLSNDTVYESVPAVHLLIIGECLDKSYSFARKFNEDKELRVALWKIGFMKQLPNLLKQESSSASCYLDLLRRMHSDNSPNRQERKSDIERKLIPLTQQILKHYNSLDPESQTRNINAWAPIVTTVLNAYVHFKDDDLIRFLPNFYPEAINILSHNIISSEVRITLQKFLLRSASLYNIIPSATIDSSTNLLLK